MGKFSYRKSIPVIPGFVYLNVSKTGISWTFKFFGISFNQSKRGTRTSVGKYGVRYSHFKRRK